MVETFMNMSFQDRAMLLKFYIILVIIFLRTQNYDELLRYKIESIICDIHQKLQNDVNAVRP